MWAGIGSIGYPWRAYWFTTGSTQAQEGGAKTQVSLHCRINLSPFTKDFRGGELLRVNCIFGASAHSRAILECQKQRGFDCLPTSSGRMRSWSFSVFAAFAILECQKQRGFDCLPTSSGRMRSWSFSVFAAFAFPVSSLHFYLASMDRQRFLLCDGIQTLDMLSLGLGSKKYLFSSSRPISDSCASSLIIFTVRARQQPPNALVIFCICCPCVTPSYLFS